MKLDAVAIVNETNDTLWVRSGTFSLAQAGQVLQTLSPGKNPSLQIVRSYVDEHGREVRAELATGYALARNAGKEGQGVCVEIWQANRPTFRSPEAFSSLSPSNFTNVAQLLLLQEEGAAKDDVLDEAYFRTQNLDFSWNPLRGTRSTSVGDVLVLRTEAQAEAYVVDIVGFSLIDFQD